LTKEQAIDYAMGRAWFRCGEIRILDSTGAVERIIPFSDSAICITILFLPSWRDFWQNVWKPRSESERGRFLPTAFSHGSGLQSHN